MRLFVRTLVHIGLSIALAAFTVIFLVIFADTALSVFGNFGIRSLIGSIVNGIGPEYVLIGFAGFLAFLIFFILQWRFYGYLARINGTVQGIADGRLDFDYKIEVRRNSPFGDMAVNLNALAGRLRRALEEERRAEQTKNELITNVSHDLRTPLTSVLGYLGLIEQDRYRDEVELRHYVQIAYEKSQRLNGLINDLFEYTRMRHDASALRETSFNLVELLGELLVQFQPPLREAGMEGRLAAGEPAVTIKGDPAKLVRVFENLIANAIAYGKDGKRIVLTVGRSGSRAVVEVINYGEPIPAHDLPHIFERFYRVDKSRTQWAGGSGLGLAISKSIVEKHGGVISVSSDVDETAFRVELPASGTI
ncbi:HAMP domain-containing histidine kinase [Paenibacillus sp. IB182493]|uniref:histidine kinase n=2 Tax=Paenibacillus arenilitoris TaxID=2772299 RepID=A0A927CW93_9BACL|nr:HAMP domain-containing histidine kinase [Paenibacillus arenilitoris]